MAPTYNAVAVSSGQFDVQLASRAAALIGSLRQKQKPEQAVVDMLERLRQEKTQRESRGLNHWDAHAPRFLGGIVRKARAEKRRRHREAETFFKAKRRDILSYARAVTGNAAAAEAVASETYRELLEGGTDTSHFFMALVGNARNHLARQAYQREKFSTLEESFSGPSPDGSDGEKGEFPAFEPMSHRLEDQDPLDILIAREEENERQRLVLAAKKDPRWRFIKRKKWARPLLENVPN